MAPAVLAGGACICVGGGFVNVGPDRGNVCGGELREYGFC